MIVNFPIDLNTKIYSIEKPNFYNGYEYCIIKSAVVEINKKFDIKGKPLDWGFITSRGTRFSLNTQNKSWSLTVEELQPEIDRLNKKKEVK